MGEGVRGAGKMAKRARAWCAGDATGSAPHTPSAHTARHQMTGFLRAILHSLAQRGAAVRGVTENRSGPSPV